MLSCQPMTLYALATVNDARALADQLHLVGGNGRHVGPDKFRAVLAAAGVTPSYGKATLFPIKDNFVLLLANHEYDIPLRALIAKDVDGLKMAGRCFRCESFRGSTWESLVRLAVSRTFENEFTQVAARQPWFCQGSYASRPGCQNPESLPARSSPVP